MKKMETILIAGGSGMIGKALTRKWRTAGHRVRILTRKESDPHKKSYHWDPVEGTYDKAALDEVTVIVNLAGSGIADRRWTPKRKQQLLDSRVGTTEFLWEMAKDLPTLEQFITASGVNCYGYDKPERKHPETDPFGDDTLSEIVRRWEAAAGKFEEKCVVSKVRTSMVLAKDDGALGTITKPIRLFVGSPIGNGKQLSPWIHLKDLAGIYNHLMVNRIGGAFNANAGNSSNQELTKAIAGVLHKPLWMPNVPGKLLEFFLGEMASMMLETLQADNAKIRETGYQFRFEGLKEAVSDLYGKKKKS